MKHENLQRVYHHIDNNFENHVKNIQEFIRQPTISNTGEGMEEGAEHLRGVYEKLGCQIAEIRETPGYPVVYGEIDAEASKTLLIYMMYDCMPADEPGWVVPPFEAKLVSNHQIGNYPPFESVLMARGAINSKGPLMAFLNTVQSIQTTDQLPVNLILLAEGEEEQASRIITVNTPGSTSADHDSFKYKNRRHPIYPLEPETEYNPAKR